MNYIDNNDLQVMFSKTTGLQCDVAELIQQRQCDVTSNAELSPSAKVEYIVRLQRIQDAWMKRLEKELSILDDLIVW